MTYVVMTYIAMACIAIAYIGMAYIAMAYITIACITIAYIVMSYIVMACIIMADLRTAAHRPRRRRQVSPLGASSGRVWATRSRSIFSNFSAHANGERGGLDRIGWWHRNGLGWVRL